MKPSSFLIKPACALLFLAFALIIPQGALRAQVGKPLTVTGRVIDIGTNESLPGVNVTVKGTQTGTVTNANGY